LTRAPFWRKNLMLNPMAGFTALALSE
jgi:hypothetical protein